MAMHSNVKIPSTEPFHFEKINKFWGCLRSERVQHAAPGCDLQNAPTL